MRTINEVVALRGVFYKLFEAKQSEQQESANNNNVLISMNLPELEMNPFHNYE